MYCAQNAKKYNRLKTNTLMSPVRKPLTLRLHPELINSKTEMVVNLRAVAIRKRWKSHCLGSCLTKSITLSVLITQVTSIHPSRLKIDAKTMSLCTISSRVKKSQIWRVMAPLCSTWWQRSGCCSGVILRMAPESSPA